MIGKHIAIIDDDTGVQEAARLIFERVGYRVSVYPNGELILNNTIELPDIFILDKQLSGVDGLDICRFLKGQKLTRHIPVLMLSASPHIGRLAAASAADDFLGKPFKMLDLREKVAKLLNDPFQEKTIASETTED